MAANITGSADQAGTQVRQLAQSAATIEGLEGLSLSDIVSDIEGRGLKRGDLKKLLRTDEALAGFDALSSNQEAFDALLGEIAQTQTDRLALTKAGFADTDPALAAARTARIESNQRILSEEPIGIAANAATALEDSLIRGLREQDASGFNVFATEWQLFLRRIFSGDADFVDQHVGFADEATQRRIGRIGVDQAEDQGRGEMVELLREANQMMAEQNQLLKSRPRRTPSAAQEN